MQWPTEKDIGTIRDSICHIVFLVIILVGVPPAGYETLDGFKGVFISTRVL